MKYRLGYQSFFKTTLCLISLLMILSCITEEIIEPEKKRTILFYIGSDTNGLDNGSVGDEPRQQIDAIRAGWIPGRGELIIYADQTNRPPCLMRINETRNKDGLFGIDTLQIYPEENSADAAVLNRVIHTVVRDFPADSYGLLFFSHASGWLPEGALTHPRSAQSNPRSLVIDKGDGVIREMSYTDFAAAIPDNLFDFIIFDACLMADVLSMYELRNKTEYVLASSAEIVSPGYTPIYQNEIKKLVDTRQSTRLVVTGFAQSYMDYIKKTYSEEDIYCSATLSVIRMDEMPNLASTVKDALNGKRIDETTLAVDLIQRFDRPNKLIVSGQRKNRYFDLEHVIETVALDSHIESFRAQMKKTVVWKSHTKRFLLTDSGSGNPNYADYDGYFINHHSGLTTYIEQTAYPVLNVAYQNSSWYKAIH